MQIHPNARPKLKHSVSIQSDPKQGMIRVGSQTRVLWLPNLWNGVNPLQLIALLDGNRTIAQIGSKAGTGTAPILELVQELTNHHLVDLFHTPISFAERYNPDVGYIEKISDTENFPTDKSTENFLRRMEIECDAATFAEGDLDAGRSAVLQRRKFSILIFGRGRIVNTLYGALSASGFSNIKVINRLSPRHPDLKITEADLSGGFINQDHIGQSRRKTLADLERGAALFPDRIQNFLKPDLAISIGSPSPDALQRWISEGTNHLLVEVFSSAEVRVGPFVIPGKTPCFRCVELSTGTSAGKVKGAAAEVGVALSYAVASSIAADVSLMCAHKKTVFIATSITYSMHEFHKPKEESWLKHPGCGCGWQ